MIDVGMGYVGAKTNPGRDTNIVFDGLHGIGPTGALLNAHGLDNASGCPGGAPPLPEGLSCWAVCLSHSDGAVLQLRRAHCQPDSAEHPPQAGRSLALRRRGKPASRAL